MSKCADYNYVDFKKSSREKAGIEAMSNLPQVYGKYELLFTPSLIPRLRNLRGEEWAELIDTLATLPETDPDALAFAMMMIGLGSCLSCEYEQLNQAELKKAA
jgi:hypothetical protein